MSSRPHLPRQIFQRQLLLHFHIAQEGIGSGCFKGAQKSQAVQMLLFGARGYPEFRKPTFQASDLNKEEEESSSDTTSLESDGRMIFISFLTSAQ
ncbi:hypothetical protein BDP27DRAFT_1416585 [Rhodocollybia butyracea]|uniref:Uncharacterized protein n=1 Tax=Rhodocollybia butyracea TaxID=206335 RepID=A0A9P5Q3U2_9AGAR|nr:hypothetical protein BDP27DRAFT_1416585 [Rhodocollybia butyracea]